MPERALAPGLAPNAMVTVPVNAVAVLPNWSRAVTVTAGVIGVPAVAALGCAVKARWLAVAGVIVKAALEPVAAPAAAAVSV